MINRIRKHLESRDKTFETLKGLPLKTPTKGRGVYKELLSSIISQQLSTKAAASIEQKVLTHFGGDFPSAHELRDYRPENLRSLGLSFQKATYLINVARYFDENNLKEGVWQTFPDEEIITRLTEIKGVGRWTVEMILIFELGRPDVFPVDDLGIREAMVSLYKLRKTKTLKKRLLSIASKWVPYRSYGSRLMWKYRDTK